jgi:hypothetical protein
MEPKIRGRASLSSRVIVATKDLIMAKFLSRIRRMLRQPKNESVATS